MGNRRASAEKKHFHLALLWFPPLIQPCLKVVFGVWNPRSGGGGREHVDWQVGGARMEGWVRKRFASHPQAGLCRGWSCSCKWRSASFLNHQAQECHSKKVSAIGGGLLLRLPPRRKVPSLGIQSGSSLWPLLLPAWILKASLCLPFLLVFLRCISKMHPLSHIDYYRILSRVPCAIYGYVWLSHFAIHLKLTPHCQSTITQYKREVNIKGICWYPPQPPLHLRRMRSHCIHPSPPTKLVSFQPVIEWTFPPQILPPSDLCRHLSFPHCLFI